ncbi:dynamin family protein [Actinospica sp. MGRD01-02]|uniref:Dynamin family protein n=1 Tax=Actinospica acidithermotolerans TaxID=2828514 RepID=A0A941IJJ1_9ACTN|nr:dynamin family protein [Actinospica acidithermotolerans]MBR7827922.1 dynamin family protein [Actinospica acidithermotolerans]
MRSFDQLREIVLALFDRLDRLAADQPGDRPVGTQRFAAARERLEEGRLVTAVCGEYKAGKSTLLCALLDEPGLFPADTLPATNAVTVVRWGETERVTVTTRIGDDRTETMLIDRSEIADYVTEGGNPNNEREVLLVEIELPNPKLDSGMVLVDTPGVGGVQTDHEAATFAYLPAADALLFVTDVEKPLLESESDFLRRAIGAAQLTDDADSVVGVMTKIDQGGEYEVLLDEMRARVAELTGRDVDELALVPISAWLKLRYLETGDEEYLAESNFPALDEALWAALGRKRSRVLLGDALRALYDRANGCLAPIAAAEKAARDESGQTLEILRKQAAERSQYLAKLAADSKLWRPKLEEELKKAAKRVNASASARLEDNWTVFRDQYTAENSELLDAPERLSAQLTADFAALLGGLLKLVRKEVAKAVERFSVDQGFTLAPPRISALPDLPEPKLPSGSSIIVSNTYKGAGATKLRTAAMGAGIGAAIGGGIGALFGPIGIAVGGAVGAWLGARIGHDEGQLAVEANTEQSRRTEIIRVFSPSKIAQATYIQSLITLQFDEIRPNAVTELTSRLEQEKEAAENILGRLGADQREVEKDLTVRLAGYAAERKPFDDILIELETRARDIDLLGVRPEAGVGPDGGEA